MRLPVIPPSLLAVLLVGSLPAWAGPIPIVIFSTGVDNAGILLLPGALDPHYTMISSPEPGYPGPSTYVDPWTGTAADPWGSHFTASANFITLNNNAEGPYCCGAEGTYIYRTTFLLPLAFNPQTDTASITGFWAVDNTGLDIFINGHPTGNITSGGIWGFMQLSPLSITSNFQPGLNTLDFVIWQDGSSPTGILVQMTGEYEGTSVPEPSSLALLGIGLIGLIGCGWKVIQE